MVDNQNGPSDSFLGDIEFESANGNESVANSSESLTLEEINALTGRTYKDKPTALKSIKETYSMVGKVGKLEPKVKELEGQLEAKDQTIGEIVQIKEQLFYSENSQYKPYKEIISAMGTDPSKVVETEAFKKVFEGLSEVEKTKSAKSVLVTNPRIGQAKTKIEEAKTLNDKGQYTDAGEAATAAVLEAYEL